MAAAACSDIRRDLLCPVCSEEFTNPRILNCEHVFCSKCLAKLRVAENKLICPVCKKEQLFGSGGKIEDLHEPSNVTKLNENVTQCMTASMNSDRNTGDRICDMCAGNKKANHVCHQCMKNLCAVCEEKHSTIKPYKHHKVTPLSKHTVCSEHKGELKTLYCNDCQAGICVICYEGKHDAHSVVDVHEMVPSKAEDLHQFRRITENIKKGVISHESEMKAQDASLDREYSTAQHQLMNLRNTVNEMIAQAEERMQQKLQAEQEKLLVHSRHIEEAKAAQENLAKYVDDLLTKGSDEEIISAADDIPSISTNVAILQPKLEIPNVQTDDITRIGQSLVTYKTLGSGSQ